MDIHSTWELFFTPLPPLLVSFFAKTYKHPCEHKEIISGAFQQNDLEVFGIDSFFVPGILLKSQILSIYILKKLNVFVCVGFWAKGSDKDFTQQSKP